MSAEPPDPGENPPANDPSIVDFGAIAFIVVLMMLGLLLMFVMVRQ
ncbi:MAG TPA: hypothetical protein VGR61_00020 [Candidatus Dormibacteraeota bacterium]|nr:hypothetical protein [Candidatus Dormibacteraeota bacterium]